LRLKGLASMRPHHAGLKFSHSPASSAVLKATD
jgi:hypothetical protein